MSMAERKDDALDLLVRGGRVIDPASGLDAVCDVGIRYGRIAAIAEDLSDLVAPARQEYPPETGTTVVDAAGKLVVPGLVDMHAHVYTGVCPLTVPADETSAASGVTTIVSAGDAGAHTFEGFRQLIVNQSRTRVLAFVHISTIGLTGWPEGEAVDLKYLDVDKVVRAIEENRDIAVGIKVREQAPLIVGDNGLEPVRIAVEAGERAGVPVMVHIGGAPATLGELMQLLRPGDIITHCFTPAPHGLVEDGQLIEEAQQARDRGIVFDVGHGFGSFDYGVVEQAVERGFWPDTISTDLHSLSIRGPVGDLPRTMAKLLNLGMPLTEVVRAATVRPAAVIGRSETLGILREGGVADVAVLSLEDSDEMFVDASGAQRPARKLLRAEATIRAGILWGGPFPHPGRAAGSRASLDFAPRR
jgi:dihydroorotase